MATAGNSIHPTAVIEGDVVLGSGNTILPHAVILGPCRIGDGNWIGPHTCIGTPGEFNREALARLETAVDGPSVVIGNDNVIREFVAVQQGSFRPTSIGDGCYIMDGAHVPHDGVLEDECVIACSVLIGGSCVIGRRANIGLGSALHQGVVVGAVAMVGMQSAVTTHRPPFSLSMGVPARTAGANRVGMARAGFDDPTVALVHDWLRDGNFDDPPADLPESVSDEVSRFRSQVEDSQHH